MLALAACGTDTVAEVVGLREDDVLDERDDVDGLAPETLLPPEADADVAGLVVCDAASPSQPASARTTTQTATPTPADRPRIMRRTYRGARRYETPELTPVDDRPLGGRGRPLPPAAARPPLT